MTQPAFTPGPWEIRFGRDERMGTNYPYQIISKAGDNIITSWGAISRRATREGQANAHLITTAPSGYALAEEIINHLYTKQDIDRIRTMARELLAKADGKESQ